MSTDGNLEKYNSAEVVSYYENQTELQDCEVKLFDKHLSKGMSILDMGVGGGRTTPALAAIAERYVGADYAQPMVDACQKKFPELEFRHCDATDLSQFVGGEFDAVVFSFNGIDVIRTDDGRAKCLQETARVLKPGGIFIFSSHNAKVLGVWPAFRNARPHQLVWRSIRAIFKSLSIMRRTLASGAYSAGEGYILDPVHGGMAHYVSTPQTMIPQLERAGFTVLEQVGGHYPAVSSENLSPWVYYAAKKGAARQ